MSQVTLLGNFMDLCKNMGFKDKHYSEKPTQYASTYIEN